MYMTPANNNVEPQNPTSAQYPLRPTGRVSPFRINILKSLRLHPVTSILAGLLTLGLGLAVYARHKPNYVAASFIYVSPTVPKTLVEDRELERPYETYIQDTVHAINQYSVLAEALHRLPPGTWLNPGESEQSGVQRLQQSLDIGRVGASYQVSIGLDGPRPEHLAEIVNTITQVYIDKAKSDEFYGRDDRLSTLKDERTRISTDIDARQKEQAQLTRDLGVATFSSKGTNVFDEQNAKVQGDLTSAHEKTIEAQAQLNALKSGDPNAPNSALNAAAEEAIASDPGLMAMKSSLSQKRAEAIGRLDGLTPANPAYKQTQDQLAQIDKALADMERDLRRQAAARLEQKYRTQLYQSEAVENRLTGDLQHGTHEATAAAPKIQRAEAVQADLDRLQGRLAAVDDRISNLELESSSPGSVHLFSPAMTPLGPEKSKATALLVLIFPFALFVGIIAALVMDLIDPHIYTALDVEALLGFAPIGMLFDDREVTQMVFDECALRLAAGVDHAARLGGARTFVLTAVNTGAGTTSIVENLGSMLAKLGRKTLLIDPSGNNEPVAFVTFGTALQRRPVTFPDAGPAPTAPSTGLQAVKPGRSTLPARQTPMSGFVFERFQNMSADYDIVLIDAAPLLLSAETEYLARMADVTVLISEAGTTKKAWLTRAARLLERLGVAGAAAIVNKVHPSRVEEAMKHDLREYELRSDKANMQDWWKKKAPAAAVPNPAEPQKDRADEEDVIYARDL
jgi:succinoglycan biosynthesis transport protein ExoP